MRPRNAMVAAAILAMLSASAAAQEVRMLNGFNSVAELDRLRWGKPAKALSREHVTEGTRSVKVTFPGNVRYGGFGIRDAKLLSDWDRWDLLTLDVFNPSQKIYTIVIRIDDDQTKADDWATWYTGSFKVFPGANRIEVEVAKLARPHAKGKLNTARLRQLALWTGMTPEDKVLTFDNFALRKFKKASLPIGLRAYDFGSAKSAVQAGFTQVTPRMGYTAKRGYGFTSGGLHAREDLPRVIEALGKDSVGGKDLTFTVKLPDGRYTVWAATGFVDSYNWPRKGYTVRINGDVVFEHTSRGETGMEAGDPLADDYRRGTALWDKVVRGRLFDAFETDVRVRRGELKLSMTSTAECRLRGLAIWREDDLAAAKAMKAVHADRRDVFHKRWREIRPADARQAGMPRTTADEFTRGYLLARRNLLEEITPYWRPKMEDRFTRVAVAAAPGERAAATFIVYPIKDLKDCKVLLKPFRGAAGVIPAAAVEVNTVQYRYRRDREDAYRVSLAHLVPRSTFDAQAHVPRVIWLNVNVPADAKPGRYAAPVGVNVGMHAVGFVLDLEVYPFTLDRPEQHGVVYAHASRIEGTPDEIEADLRCLAKYGCNSVTPSGTIGGKLQGTGGKSVFTFDRLDLVMERMRKVGMTGPVPLFDQSIQGYAGGASKWHVGWQVLDEKSDWAENMTRLTRQILDRAKAKNYLPVLMYPSTEASNDPKVGPRFNSLIIKAIRAGGTCKCISSVNHPEDIVTAKELDHIMLNFGAGITQETIDRVHASGAKLWFQNVGQTRYVDGFFMLRTGAIGHRQWVANWPSGDPYNDWDGMDGNSMLFPYPGGTLPSIKLARMGEGVTDHRTFLTLRRHIAEARKAGLGGVADAAQKEMDAMIATCPVQLPDGARVLPDGLAVIDGFTDLDTFDRYRRNAVSLIIRLRQAMGKR